MSANNQSFWSLNRAFLIAAIVIAISVESSAQEWTRGIHSERSRGDVERLLELATVSQTETRLVGEFSFTTTAVTKGETPRPPLIIKGREERDGSFWPSAALQVKSEPSGEWKSVASSITDEPASATITVYTRMGIFGLHVNFDPLKPYIKKARYGKLILKSGFEAEFRLDYLLPPT